MEIVPLLTKVKIVRQPNIGGRPAEGYDYVGRVGRIYHYWYKYTEPSPQSFDAPEYIGLKYEIFGCDEKWSLSFERDDFVVLDMNIFMTVIDYFVRKYIDWRAWVKVKNELKESDWRNHLIDFPCKPF